MIAERVGWPVGAVEACERIEELRPGLRVGWFSENTTRGFECPAGFYAWLDGDDPGTTVYPTDGPPRWIKRHEWYGPTPEALEEALSTWP
ncbi:hypothetical protein [Paractinoplanes maris]|uniref:hypothetical protein n=1 Tax=Paractinoplanes maris TaxID=1734446 RepID=UPI002020EA06|nr:hypothetical protein [Actinoplanes maris]